MLCVLIADIKGLYDLEGRKIKEPAKGKDECCNENEKNTIIDFNDYFIIAI
jgi:hypothetical protein